MIPFDHASLEARLLDQQEQISRGDVQTQKKEERLARSDDVTSRQAHALQPAEHLAGHQIFEPQQATTRSEPCLVGWLNRTCLMFRTKGFEQHSPVDSIAAPPGRRR